VLEEPFEILIKGEGELKAARATAIAVPQKLWGRQQLLWLAPEGEIVAEGGAIARLDGESLRLRDRLVRDTVREIDLEIRSKSSELEKERAKLEAEVSRLEQEQADAERFAPRDPEIFSRHEILDAQIDLELLETRLEHVRRKLERTSERSEAELEILRLRRQTQSVRLGQLEEALEGLEVRAPHDGVFYPASDWRGEKLRAGSSVWTGMELGELPDLSKMEARVHVLEAEAAGLEEGLGVTVHLDAYPGLSVEGTVRTIQPIANPIEPESPVKYFEVLITLDQTDREVMRPRSQVQARIFVTREEGVLSVPNQAIFHDAQEMWVWVRRGRGFEKRSVQIGARSVSRTVVVKGLEEGERVALARPAGHEEEAG
jgi:multidrug efflux pump subunit AcrA (membrane-fusion protein)